MQDACSVCVRRRHKKELNFLEMGMGINSEKIFSDDEIIQVFAFISKFFFSRGKMERKQENTGSKLCDNTKSE